MKLIKVSQLFDIKYGNGLSLQECKLDAYGIPFVSRGSYNNGIAEYVENIQGVALNPANTITVAVGGSVMESFLQKQPYYTGYHILILNPKKEMTDAEMLYYCTCLRANKYKYNYGRQANKTLKDILIPDPVDIPNWVSTTVITPPPSAPLQNKETPKLDTSKWKEFRYGDIFDINGSKTTSRNELETYGEGQYPYVTTQATNNGIEGYYNYFTEKGGILTIDSAVLGYCSYQPCDFSASDHVEKMIPKFSMNKYIALFLVTIINQEQYRFNYGRKASQVRLKELLINLPVTPQGEPDWQFMEDYIKTLPYSGAI